jgi:YD repeat-containing protein
MKVSAITPQFEGPHTLRLTAELKGTPQEGCPVIWRFKGPSHGYAFKSTEGTSVGLSIGEQQARVTVEACLSCRGNQGGCASLTLTADILDKAQDVAAYQEIKLSDFTDPHFVCAAINDDQYQYVFYDVASSVNTVTGEYLRDREDLSVKVPGGRLAVHRWYQGGQWTWEHERHDLTPVVGPEGGITAIRKGNTPYRAVPEEKGVFTEGFFRIEQTETGYRWESKTGQWKRYNPEGRLTAFGDRNGVIGRVLFRNGRPFCLSDRNNQPVLWLEHDAEGRLRTAFDRTGRGVTYRYRDGNLSAATDLLGNETRFAYDAEGRLSEVVEPQGKTLGITYNDLGRVASVLDRDGKGHRFTWDYDQEVSLFYVRIEDPSGKVTEIWSNREGQARRVDVNGKTVHKIEKQGHTLIVTDARGLVTRKTFDQKGNLLEVVHPDGATVKKEYDPRLNRPIKTIDENKVETHFAYDDKGHLMEKKEAAGTPSERVTAYTYDGDGNLLSTTQRGDEKTPETVTRNTYDPNGSRTSTTDPEGHTTRFTYDTQGNLLTRTDPAGAMWRYAYDLAGRLTRTQDPLGHETRYFYDAQGRKIREVDPKGNETRYAYDDKGNLIQRMDALGNTTRFEYDAAGNLTRQIDPEGKENRFAYDTHGRMVLQTDGAGNETRRIYETPDPAGCPTCVSGGTRQPDRIVYPTFTKRFAYDQRGRKIEETDVLSESKAYTTLLDYDPAGNRILKTDKMGRTTTYEFDALNRLTQVTDPLGNPTHYVYDSRDNLVSLTDAKGQTTEFAYDRNNRLVKETRPMGQETAYAYDSAGNLREKTDAKGQSTVYGYDKAGRLTTIRYFSGPDDQEPVKTVALTYDEAGNLKGYDDGSSSAEYTYDAVYRKTEETVDFGPFAKTIAYTYYGNGLKRTYTDPEGVTYTYAYNANNQLAEVHIPGHGAITYASYHWSQPEKISLPGGSTREYQYDPLMRVKRIGSRDPEQNVITDL